MYSIRHIHHICGVCESRIYRPTPFRVICRQSGYISALHAARVYLWHITIRSGRVELNCVGNLVAIHWLREMDLKWDSFCRGHTKVVPGEKLGDDWRRRYEFILWNQRFEAPGC